MFIKTQTTAIGKDAIELCVIITIGIKNTVI